MPINDPRWRFALDRPPEIVAAGIGVGGANGPERYLLPNLWCAHLYLYEVELVVGDVSYFIEPGSLSIIPPNVSIWFRYTRPGKHCYVHFREGRDAGTASRSLAPMTRLGDRFEEIYSAIASAVAAQKAAPFLLTARTWNLLCGIAELVERPSAPTAPAIHPAVRRAQELIELGLDGALSVEELAKEADISKSYLSKLFQKASGNTVAGYIIRRRMSRAFHLLANTTMPIKAVAYSVGLPDLQQFNKAIRRAYGRSPRAVRELSEC